MPAWLTPEEKFADRVEALGYLSAMLAGGWIIVYFGMIFFYDPVKSLAVAAHAVVLGVSAAFLVLCLLLLRQVNASRLLVRWAFAGLAAWSGAEVLDGGRWWPAILGAYAFAGFWILSQPAALSRFRPLRPREARLGNHAAGFTLWVTALTMYALATAWSGLRQLAGDDSATVGFKRLFVAVVFLALVPGLWRLWAWMRWLTIAVLGVMGLAALPATFSAQRYADYWLALAKCSIFLGGGAYLAFSKFGRTRFSGPKPLSPPAPRP